jgi:hypothetical protein
MKPDPESSTCMTPSPLVFLIFLDAEKLIREAIDSVFFQMYKLWARTSQFLLAELIHADHQTTGREVAR